MSSTLYILDTNISSYIIKGNKIVRKHLLSVKMSQLCISAVTQAELLLGVEKKPEAKSLRLAVKEFLLRMDVLLWDAEAAQAYATMRADLERHGVQLGNLDMLIAAHALAINATLVTHDKAFSRVKKLKLSDWMRE